jgi:hypothetical protein
LNKLITLLLKFGAILNSLNKTVKIIEKVTNLFTGLKKFLESFSAVKSFQGKLQNNKERFNLDLHESLASYNREESQ